jgi:hypothetical protein
LSRRADRAVITRWSNGDWAGGAQPCATALDGYIIGQPCRQRAPR